MYVNNLRRFFASLAAAVFFIGAALPLAGCGPGADAPPASIPAGKSLSPGDDGGGAVTHLTSVRGNQPSPAMHELQKPSPSLPPRVRLHTSAGPITLELYRDEAPRTVANFLENYVERRAFEGTIFHHAASGIVLGGGYTADLQPISRRAEIWNEADNGLPNVRGAVAMARYADSIHSATSEFFINVADNPDFNHRGGDDPLKFGYCVFARVVEGMEVIDRIAQSQTQAQGEFANLPHPLVVIERVDLLR